MITLRIGLAAIALLAAVGPAASKPFIREFRDFVVACDNVATCVARWAPEEGSGGFEAYLSISRDAGPAGRLAVELASPETSRRLDPQSLRLDGRLLRGDFRWRGEETLIAEGDRAAAFVRTIRDADRLTFVEGGVERTVTLRGLKAALLAMDDAQGRVGTTGALARNGDLADASVPPPPPFPVVVARPATAAEGLPGDFAAQVRLDQAALLKARDCQDDHPDADEAYPLTRTEAVVFLICWTGAYQSSALVLRVPRYASAQARVVATPLAPGDEPPPPEMVGLHTMAEWDPQSATLTEAARGRGLADCGQFTSWVFDGAEFHLAEAQRMNRCSGGPPGEWLTVYRATVEVR